MRCISTRDSEALPRCQAKLPASWALWAHTQAVSSHRSSNVAKTRERPCLNLATYGRASACVRNTNLQDRLRRPVRRSLVACARHVCIRLKSRTVPETSRPPWVSRRYTQAWPKQTINLQVGCSELSDRMYKCSGLPRARNVALSSCKNLLGLARGLQGLQRRSY